MTPSIAHELARPDATMRYWATPEPTTSVAPTLVLLHGATLDHRAWDVQVAALQQSHPLVVPDLRAHGESTGDFTFRAAVDDVRALLDILPADDVVLVGLSLGANIAQELARQEPGRFQALVLADATCNHAAHPPMAAAMGISALRWQALTGDNFRASATRSSTTTNGWWATSRKSWPWRLQHGDRRPVAGGDDREALARRSRAGPGSRGARSGPTRRGTGRGRRRHTWLPSVIAEPARVEELLGELRGQADPVRGVLAVHDADVDLELVAQVAQAGLDGPAAGRAEHVAQEEDAHRGDLGRRRGPACLDVHVLARVLRVARERGALDGREVDQPPELRAGGDHGSQPTLSAGSAERLCRTTTLGFPESWISICLPCGTPSRMRSEHGDHSSLDPRVNVGARGAPTSSSPVFGPVPPSSW